MPRIRVGLLWLVTAACTLSVYTSASVSAAPIPIAAPRIINIGLGQQTDQMVKGAVVLRAFVTANVSPKSVSFYLKDKEIGQATAQPFRLVWNSTATPDGVYTIKAVASNGTGQQVWTGESRISVQNNSSASATSAPPGGPIGVAKTPRASTMPPPPGGIQAGTSMGAGVPKSPSTTMRTPSSTRPPAPPAAPKAPVGSVSPAKTSVVVRPPIVRSAAPAVIVWKTYSTEKYGFTIDYPGTAVVIDESSSMRPRETGAFWIAFTQKTGGKLQYAINVRHRLLSEPGDADKYAKYNPYLLKWERTNVSNMSGFKTMSGSKESKRAIHRTLLVDRSAAWMFNLTDVSGNDPSITKAIFDRVVQSFKPQATAAVTRVSPPRPVSLPKPVVTSPKPAVSSPRMSPPKPVIPPKPEIVPEPPAVPGPEPIDDLTPAPDPGAEDETDLGPTTDDNTAPEPPRPQ